MIYIIKESSSINYRALSTKFNTCTYYYSSPEKALNNLHSGAIFPVKDIAEFENRILTKKDMYTVLATYNEDDYPELFI